MRYISVTVIGHGGRRRLLGPDRAVEVELCSYWSPLRSPLVLVVRKSMRDYGPLSLLGYFAHTRTRGNCNPKRVLRLKKQTKSYNKQAYYGNAEEAAARSSASRASATASDDSGARASRTAPSSGHSSQVKSDSAAASSASQTQAAPLLGPF